MKVTVIGDIHGREIWKEIVDKNPDSNFVFTGDYVDPYRSEFIDEEDAIDNLIEIINFKNENPSTVHLLIGNHDAQYLFYPEFATSAISKKYFQEIKDLFDFNKNLFQFSIQKDSYLFIHAGISNGWFKYFRKIFDDFGLKSDLSNLAVTINKISKSKWREDCLGTISHYRRGYDPYGGPLWADKRELFNDYLTGFHQITGHNKVDGIIKIGNAKNSITFCDCLWIKDESLTLNI